MKEEIIFHRRRLKLNKQDFIFYVDFFCAFGNWAAHQALPRGQQACFIKLGFNAEGAQHLPHRISNGLKIIFAFATHDFFFIDPSRTSKISDFTPISFSNASVRSGPASVINNWP